MVDELKKKLDDVVARKRERDAAVDLEAAKGRRVFKEMMSRVNAHFSDTIVSTMENFGSLLKEKSIRFHLSEGGWVDDEGIKTDPKAIFVILSRTDDPEHTLNPRLEINFTHHQDTYFVVFNAGGSGTRDSERYWNKHFSKNEVTQSKIEEWLLKLAELGI